MNTRRSEHASQSSLETGEARGRVLDSFVWIVAATWLALAGAAGAFEPPTILQQKLHVRLEGYLDAPAEKVHPWRELEVRLAGTSEGTRHFALTNIVVISGDGSGFGLLEQIAPTRPNLFLAGDKDVIGRIEEARPDEVLKISGFIAFGSRWLLVDRVEREG